LRIIAIGGGELNREETISIDQAIAKSAKEKPQILFIPTASGDSENYVSAVKSIYQEKLGCTVDVMYLTTNDQPKSYLEEQIENADIIYVGGGDTIKMLDAWEAYGVDTMLMLAYKNGKILSGLSAGSICWFESGLTDVYSQGHLSFTAVNGLGLLQGIHCPHYNKTEVAHEFDQMVLKANKIGIAIEDCCAIDFHNDTYKILKSNSDSKAYKLYKNDGVLVKQELTNTDEFWPIQYLWDR
jgi:dipeptidase E